MGRYRKKQYEVLNVKLLKRFKKEHKKYKDVKNKTLYKIATEFHDLFFDEVGRNPGGCNLPNRLGLIILISYTGRKSINRALSTKENKVYYNNSDTNDLMCKITYSNYNPNYLFADKGIWYYRPDQNSQRELSKVFKRDFSKYMYLSKLDKLTSIIYDSKKEVMPTSVGTKFTRDLIKEYDEFNM